LLERALRIEPQNPHYWYTMALVKYRQGKYQETVQFCLKAGSLAGQQPQLTSRNQELLKQAREEIASQ
jgi:cytochrome c-type biogenesis protein CcmH/NrfG